MCWCWLSRNDESLVRRIDLWRQTLRREMPSGQHNGYSRQVRTPDNLGPIGGRRNCSALGFIHFAGRDLSKLKRLLAGISGSVLDRFLSPSRTSPCMAWHFASPSGKPVRQREGGSRLAGVFPCSAGVAANSPIVHVQCRQAPS